MKSAKKFHATTLPFVFCFWASNDAKPFPSPTGAFSGSNVSFFLALSTEGWPLASFTPFAFSSSTASGVTPELIKLKS
uniref:Secreted protein n=1 Tax=Rhizophora mucronata TaxID=61149 RepID=A0A2P2N0M5_RHIMU